MSSGQVVMCSGCTRHKFKPSEMDTLQVTLDTKLYVSEHIPCPVSGEACNTITVA